MKNGFLSFLICVVLGLATLVSAAPQETIPPKERCPVCGMFVAKYAAWISQIHTESGKVYMFDGVKDMMIYYHNPSKYGKSEAVKDIYVKDYYSQQWIDGREAIYVIGSDVLGPMGHEFIPFSNKDEALTFKKDHHGKGTLYFDDITPEVLSSMATNMKSHGKMGNMKHGN